MAWLWAQFCVSKTVSLKKCIVGATPVRKSTVFSSYFDSRLEKWGGLIDFYRSSVEKLWTDSGLNVPNYPLLYKQWWRNIARATRGELTPQEAMDNVANDMDRVMEKLKTARYSPKLAPRRSREYWLNKPGAPKKEIPGTPPPITVPYEELLKMWRKQ